MNRTRSLALLAAAVAGLSLVPLANAASYYIDPVNGNDSNNGTSIALAKKTIPGLTTGSSPVTLAPGDIVYLRGTGHFPQSHFDNTWSKGTSGNPVIVRPYNPGGGAETVIFDPGYAEFKTGSVGSPNSAWVPYTGPDAAPDEYVSVNTFAVASYQGSFLQSNNGIAGDRLLSYSHVEDLRGGIGGSQTVQNESEAQVAPSDPRNAGGLLANDNPNTPVDERTLKHVWTYRGPGLWYNPTTQKIHFRAAATNLNQTGIVDYSGPTDPRTMPISISGTLTYAFDINVDDIRFENIIFQNGGTKTGTIAGSGSNYCERATFDHCKFYLTRNGVTTTLTKFLKFQHCEFNGKLPSYTTRADVKDEYEYLETGTGIKKMNGQCRETQAGLLGSHTSNEDMEIANCEFRNAHDAVQVWGKRTKVHHTLFENINDEAVMFFGNQIISGPNLLEPIEIYNNVFRKCLQAFSNGASEGHTNSTNVRFVYRNIVDFRIPILGERILPPDGNSIWRPSADVKASSPFPRTNYYQNTFIVGPQGVKTSSSVWDMTVTSGKPVRYLNNLFMAIQDDKHFYDVPNPATADYVADGNILHRRMTSGTAPLFRRKTAGTPYYSLADLISSGIFPGWEANSQTVYPQFAAVGDYAPSHGGAYLNADFRLAAGSTAIGAGVNLVPNSWPDTVAADTTPDIGALPYGTSAVAVGIDSLKVFPDGTTPIAEAGDYSIIPDADQTGFENVSFTASGSSDPDGSISSYDWVYNGATISTSSTFSKDLPIGTHDVYLTVTDNSGKTATDLRQITITDPASLDNLVRNPGYENGSTDWLLTNAATASTPTHFGAGVLKMIGQASAANGLQDVPIIPGAATRVSTWLKTDTIPITAKAKFQLLWLDATKTPVGVASYPANNIGGTTGWTYYPTSPTSYTAPANAVYARVTAGLDGAATGGFAYFDDVRVQITDNKLTNGFMERGKTAWTIIGGAPSTTTTNAADVWDGTAAMVAPGDATLYIVWSQSIPATPATVYTFSGRMKTTGTFAAGKAAKIHYEWYDAAGVKIGSTMGIANVTAAQPYTRYTASMTAPASTASLKILLILDGGAPAATAYFDSIYVK